MKTCSRATCVNKMVHLHILLCTEYKQTLELNPLLGAAPDRASKIFRSEATSRLRLGTRHCSSCTHALGPLVKRS